MEKITHRTLRDQVAATLRQAILKKELKPGQPLIQEELAKELNISRMPVREALMLLQNEGLIVNSPHKGAVVARFTREDIREIYQIRRLLEGYATTLAARNMTPADLAELDQLMDEMGRCLESTDHQGYAGFDQRFHQVIFRCSGNKRLVKMITGLWNSFPMYLAYSIQGRIARSHKEQTLIVEALRRGDADRAAEFCRRQIETVYQEMEPHFLEEGETPGDLKNG
ncbi:MAG: GntR family transcriptional regulator [Thermodesulfobacteriota bacterium]